MKHIYLSATPEALIASMLPPLEFGDYLSTGTKKQNRGQAIFFEVDLAQIEDLIDMESLNKRCVPHPDGKPKNSVYLSVYRVLEKIPLAALKSLYLTSDNGYTLELKKHTYDASKKTKNHLHLFQELLPVNPLVASDMTPSAFLKRLTDGSISIVLPKLFFVDLKLGGLAANPQKASAEYLPYINVGHLKDCLEVLTGDYEKHMKTVLRVFSGSILYRTIESGFYIGAKDEMYFYPFPTMAELEDTNYEFYRSI
jgi:hypothetical protein